MLRAKNKKYAAYGEGALMKKFLASRGVGGASGWGRAPGRRPRRCPAVVAETLSATTH